MAAPVAILAPSEVAEAMKSTFASVAHESLARGEREQGGAMGSTVVYELRIYHVVPGKIENLVARFRDHTMKLFADHGIKSVDADGFFAAVGVTTLPQDIARRCSYSAAYVPRFPRVWSLCARGPRHRSCGIYRAQEARPLAPQAERGCPSRLRGLLRTRRGALGSGRSGLCLRAYTGVVSDAELRTITVD